MESRTPKVTVCLPTLNGAKFVHLSITSVCKQSYKDFELIVCDDASTDNTIEIVSTISDERLSIYRNPKRLGLANNWNRCLELARGRYVTIFHQDDVMLADNLALKVAWLESNPTVGFVYSNIHQIDEKGHVIGGHWAPQPQMDCILPGWKIFERVAAIGNSISCPSVVARTECYQRLGKFNPKLAFATDLEMWMRIATVYDIAYIHKPLIAQRVHSEQETARFQGTGKDYLDVLHALDIVFERRLPQQYSRYRHLALRTLCSQAFAMARWMARQRKIVPAIRYLWVAGECLFRLR